MIFLNKVINVLGIHRAGNHPILEWIQTLYPSIAFFNNITCSSCLYTEKIISFFIKDRPSTLLLSYEDIPLEIDISKLYEYKAFNLHDMPSDKLINCIVLRDLYNHLASYVKLESFQYFEFSEFVAFIYLWKQYAKAYLSGDYVPLSYNHWFTSEDYRRKICDILGGTYSEASLDTHSTSGGGSSFKRNFFISARQLKVTDNWRYFIGHKNFGAFSALIDPEMRSLNREIFGDVIDIDYMESKLWLAR